MTSSNETTDAAAVQEQPELLPSKILELLERLSAGERLVDAPLAMGLSQEQARAIFIRVTEIVRKNLSKPAKNHWSIEASDLDWSGMTVAEALEILSRRAVKREDATKEGG